MCEIGLTREEFYNITLGEFYERDYAFEYKNSLALHEVRVAIRWKIIMNADPKEPKVPELHDIYHLWMLGDKIKGEVPEKEILPLSERKTAQEMLDSFDF